MGHDIIRLIILFLCVEDAVVHKVMVQRANLHADRIAIAVLPARPLQWSSTVQSSAKPAGRIARCSGLSLLEWAELVFHLNLYDVPLGLSSRRPTFVMCWRACASR